jgi:thymidylate synthase
MRQLARFIAGAALVAAWSLSAVPVNAQTTAPKSNALTSPGLSQSQPNITDQKLDKAAAALERIASLQQDFRKQVSKAVTDQGLSIDEYAEIMDVAQNDPQVRQKIMSRIAPPRDDQSKSDQSDEPTPK